MSLVSVIIPAYNRPLLLERAIQSVKNQSHKNLEIIVVDDGNQNLSNLTEKYQFKLLSTQGKRGAGFCRNLGLGVATGEFVAFLDDDDEWLPKKIEKQLQKIKSDPALSIVGCNYTVIDEVQNSKEEVNFSDAGYNKNSLKIWNVLGSCSFPLLKTSEVKAVGGFDTKLVSCQDWDLWLRVSQKYGEASFVYEPLANYYKHDEGRISSKALTRVQGYCQMLGKNRDFFPARTLPYHSARIVHSLVLELPLVAHIAPVIGSGFFKIMSLMGMSYKRPEKKK